MYLFASGCSKSFRDVEASLPSAPLLFVLAKGRFNGSVIRRAAGMPLDEDEALVTLFWSQMCLGISL